MSLGRSANPAGKIEIIVPVSDFPDGSQKYIAKLELNDLLASLPATNGALSAGVALLVKAVFTFGGRDDLDDSANAEIRNATDMVLAGIATYSAEPPPQAPQQTADSSDAVRDAVAYRPFKRWSIPQLPGGEVDDFIARSLPPDKDTPAGDVSWGVTSLKSGNWVISRDGSPRLFTGLPQWASRHAEGLCAGINQYIRESDEDPRGDN